MFHQISIFEYIQIYSIIACPVAGVVAEACSVVGRVEIKLCRWTSTLLGHSEFLWNVGAGKENRRVQAEPVSPSGRKRFNYPY